MNQKKIFLIESENHSKNNPCYEIKVGVSLEHIIRPECVIKLLKDTYFSKNGIIIARHSLGSGCDGYSPYTKEIKEYSKSKDLETELSDCAEKYAQTLADKLKIKLIDLRKIKSCSC
jgi:hypothetical protein